MFRSISLVTGGRRILKDQEQTRLAGAELGATAGLPSIIIGVLKAGCFEEIVGVISGVPVVTTTMVKLLPGRLQPSGEMPCTVVNTV